MAGFTLLELMVVLIIIGLMVNLIGGLPGGSGGQNARREAERLQNLINLLREEAVLTRKDYGLRLEADRYEVQKIDRNGQWQADKRFGEHRLTGEVSLTLVKPRTHSQHEVPQVWIFSDDQISPFNLQFYDRQRYLFSLFCDGVGEVVLAPAN
jgi:general secretion pathway protein H